MQPIIFVVQKVKAQLMTLELKILSDPKNVDDQIRSGGFCGHSPIQIWRVTLGEYQVDWGSQSPGWFVTFTTSAKVSVFAEMSVKVSKILENFWLTLVKAVFGKTHDSENVLHFILTKHCFVQLFSSSLNWKLSSTIWGHEWYEKKYDNTALFCIYIYIYINFSLLFRPNENT